MTKPLVPLLFVFLGALQPGCESPDEPAIPAGCDSTRQCFYGEVCDVIQRRCVAEPDGGVRGQFFCNNVFATSVDSGAGIGSFSEVVGKVSLPAPQGGRSLQRMNLISPAFCQIVDGRFYVQFFDPDLSIKKSGYYLIVSAPVGDLRPGALLDLTSADEYRACAATGTQAQIQANSCGQAGDTQLRMALDRAPVVGQPLLGYVDITFEDIFPPP